MFKNQVKGRFSILDMIMQRSCTMVFFKFCYMANYFKEVGCLVILLIQKGWRANSAVVELELGTLPYIIMMDDKSVMCGTQWFYLAWHIKKIATSHSPISFPQCLKIPSLPRFVCLCNDSWLSNVHFTKFCPQVSRWHLARYGKMQDLTGTYFIDPRKM